MSALFVVQGRNKKYGSINRDFWQRCYKLTGLAGWSIMRIDFLGGMGMETKEKAVQAQTGAAKGKKSRKKVWAVVIGVLIIAWILIGLTNLGKVNTVAMLALFVLTLVLFKVIFFNTDFVMPIAVSDDMMTFGLSLIHI